MCIFVFVTCCLGLMVACVLLVCGGFSVWIVIVLLWFTDCCTIVCGMLLGCSGLYLYCVMVVG